MNERRAICGRGACWEEQIVGEEGGGKREKGGDMVGEETSGGNIGHTEERMNDEEKNTRQGEKKG